ncbi:lL-diaminopimelate aminotransferase [Clostridium sp. CAG:557]|nr:lL-diaminopimelate aminotransferase [Clostridium sp. CAG:557]
MKLNLNYLNLKDSYLFANVAKKSGEFSKSHPDAEVISLGIGDVTLPLCDAVTEAMQQAVLEMSKKETFKGYGPYQGYDFLRNAIRDYYTDRNIDVNIDEIFVSDGSKSDVANILDIFSGDNTVLIPDPVYPVYVDTNVMAGRKIRYVNANKENNFLPLPDETVKADIIYLCSPNNPTGAVYNHEQLQKWVNYALTNKAIILFDAAYEAFISDESLPRSIFEIEGAKKCAIELCSFSKTAGFTGVRCGYTIVPKDMIFDNISVNSLWFRRQSTKFNGVAYIVQKGAAAVFSKNGLEQIGENINYYKENAHLIAEVLRKKNIYFTGGENSPYIWLKCPGNMSSWEFFDYLLENANIIGTPGAGFGQNGEGYFRLTSFGDRESILKAVQRLKKL